VSLNMLNLGQAGIIAVGLTVIMLMAANGMRDGSMTIGKFVLVNTYLMQLYQPLNFLGMVYMTIKQGLVDMEQMFSLLRVDQEVADKPNAGALAAHLSDGPAGEVRFENVRFGYRPDHMILKGIDLTVPAGRKLAIVGPTGAGKSTISRLLFRFYDVTGGRILIDGQDIARVKQIDLRQAIAVVPQDPALFHRTIAENIGYARPDATVEEVQLAARRARAHEFIASLPKGYETLVGERGVKLSGGERQRVAIARAFLADAPILVLDEATSSLDVETEVQVQAATEELMAGRTTIVIAHRLSTIRSADRILVFEGGRIVEEGRHGELVAKGGAYARLHAVTQGA
jgi:ABC-type transport system involved in Fe-S cluster assembly fused permease/ATPase subunit